MRNDTTSLIQISTSNVGGELIETVNARELHKFLESKQEFANWIKNRIAQYGFVEGQDFTVDKTIIGRATQIDYYISLDMAKELSMVERNEKGRQARQYFIGCERMAKGGIPRLAINSAKLEAELTIAEAAARIMRLPDSGKLLMLSSIATNNGLDAGFLPSYAVDAPSDSAAGSSEPTMSLTSLLKSHDISKGAAAYNKLLERAGMVERLTRPKKGGGTQSYWSVTEKGQRYGKNVTNQYNQLETQPHWYVGRFESLHEEVMGAIAGVSHE